MAAFYTEPLTAEEVQTNFNASYNKTAAAGGVFENACDPDEPSCAAVRFRGWSAVFAVAFDAMLGLCAYPVFFPF